MKEISIKKKVIESLSLKYSSLKNDIESSGKITGVDSDFLELATELLGNIFEKAVWLSSEEEIDESNSKGSVLIVKKGDLFDISSFVSLGYERVERVWNPGEISVLGDVVLVWPFSMNKLVRFSLLGEEIEDMTIVDVESRKKLKKISERKFLGSGQTLLVGNEDADSSMDIQLVNSIGNHEDAVDLGLRRIPNLENFASRKAIVEVVRNYQSRDYSIWYLTSDLNNFEINVEEEIRKSIERVFPLKGTFEKDIKRGFVASYAKTLVLTDLEILGQLDLSLYEKRNVKIDPGSVEILKKVVPGDYIVHEDHGIGKFEKVVKREHGPYIEISYLEKDKLFVPLSASNKLTKYIGAGKSKPILTGLNSGVWKRISKKAQEKAEDIAKELLQLYALREASRAELIFQDYEKEEEYKVFVSQFEFEDTDDQLLATEHIRSDFRNEKPMDRLLVGDVGYGKTEIAMRAMFAVANSNHQVAFLAPTTILVEQHLAVLKERFKNYPFRIASLSRFSSTLEREEALEGIKNGNIDIIVGTHSLLSDEVSFKNLGLLVVDEEQKFGVKQKEKIKAKRVDTNVLSLTATPIPRTLNMALMGIRDISVLATPPQGRKEIENYFGEFSLEKIKEAISKELERNGQVYYLHNRVGTIQGIYSKLSKMFPHYKVAIAHGQMSVQELSETMKLFSRGEVDILVCTTIIENGLDIPNVNTLVIEDASMLGLSQLYQIRGRIGRSKREAYAYFFYRSLKGDAQLRLEAIKESQELGSGFLLSNKDLEIRGAGDILGRNQSGTINSVGYGLYSQMLEKAVREVMKMGK